VRTERPIHFGRRPCPIVDDGDATRRCEEFRITGLFGTVIQVCG
jgi:hypothetical protein